MACAVACEAKLALGHYRPCAIICNILLGKSVGVPALADMQGRILDVRAAAYAHDAHVEVSGLGEGNAAPPPWQGSRAHSRRLLASPKHGCTSSWMSGNTRGLNRTQPVRAQIPYTLPC